jgi:hypothetical protein
MKQAIDEVLWALVPVELALWITVAAMLAIHG